MAKKRGGERTLVKVSVVTGAKQDRITAGKQGRLMVHVRARTQRNQANMRVRELVASHLQVSEAHVRIISGHHTPSKILEVTN